MKQALGVALLENLGCTVSSAGTGTDALAAFSRSSYDLILMDCQMPEIDGYEATRIIRERERKLATAACIATEYIDTIRALQPPEGPDLLSDLIETYFASADRLLDSLRQAVGTADAPLVMRSAHSLKSSSANLGALVLAECFKEMEILGRNDTLAGAAELLERIEAEYAGVCQALSAIRQEGRPSCPSRRANGHRG